MNDINKFVKEKVYAGVIGFETQLKNYSCFDKEVLMFNGLSDEKMAKMYWMLDGNAFGEGELAAPKYMKLDTLIMGGVPICLFLQKDDVSEKLKMFYDVEKDFYPIGFMDLHFKGNESFACSGFGISKEYQSLGLSKFLLSAGIHCAGVDSLLVPTQQSNKVALKAWNFLGGMDVVCSNPFHEQEDTQIYQFNSLQSVDLSEFVME